MAWQAGEAAGFAKKLVALGDDHILASRGYLALGVAYRKQSLEGYLLFILIDTTVHVF